MIFYFLAILLLSPFLLYFAIIGSLLLYLLIFPSYNTAAPIAAVIVVQFIDKLTTNPSYCPSYDPKLNLTQTTAANAQIVRLDQSMLGLNLN